MNLGGATAKASQKNRSVYGRVGAALLLAIPFALLLFVTGCKRERSGRLTPPQIHQVTEELAKAASQAAPNGSPIKVRRTWTGQEGGIDELYIGLRGNAGASDRLMQSLSGVATKHRLTLDPAIETGNTWRISMRSAGTVTHRIEIEQLNARNSDNSSNVQGRLAILMDDLGSDRNAAEAIFALHVPITISVLPYHVHSQVIAAAAKKHGCEVMLHLPMQSVANETPEQEELKPGLTPVQVEIIVRKMLEAVPDAEGVNNHQGSQATSDTTLMGELMPVLRNAGAFYVDSRTTAATVAYEAAKRNGVKTAFRNVPFLDDVQDKAAVKKQLQIAIRGAKEKGEAIAIGHPHATTLEALREMLPEAQKQGVRLVFVSDVVH